MKTRRTKHTHCPSCNASLDAVSDAAGYTPKPDDYSMCLHCGTLLVFTQTMDLRVATEKENRDPQIRKQFEEMYWKMHSEKLN